MIAGYHAAPDPPVWGYAVADVHVPPQRHRGTWLEVPQTADDALTALSAAAHAAAQAGCPLLIAGDLVDSPRLEADQLVRLGAALSPLRRAGLPVLYVLGNHECGEDWLAAFSDFCVNLDHQIEPFVWSGVRYVGRSYQADVDALSAALAPLRDDPAEVGVYHQPWSELLGSSRQLGVRRAADLPAHAIAVLGDIHRPLVWSAEPGPHQAVSPGSLTPQSVGEFAHLPPRVWALRPQQIEPIALPHRDCQWWKAGPDDESPDQIRDRLRSLPPVSPGEPARLVALDWRFPDRPTPEWLHAVHRDDVILWVRPRRAELGSPAAGGVRRPADGLIDAVRQQLGDSSEAELAQRLLDAAVRGGRAAAAQELAAAAAAFAAAGEVRGP